MKSSLIYHLCFYYCCFSISWAKSKKKIQPILIVHGGAEDGVHMDRIDGKIKGIRQAVRVGYEYLLHGGSAVDAVEAAVAYMEQDEYFDAGYGAYLNIRGEVEMDAAIVRGEDLNVGAVVLVKDFWHPISIARKVLTDSPHAIIGGEGVNIFAKEKGFQEVPRDSLITQNAVNLLEEYLSKKNNECPKAASYVMGVDTVGAVALDANGHFAAATSSGGLTGKAVGRVSDVAQIGAGTYADDYFGAVSSTGHGESILKFGLAHKIIYLLQTGLDAETATNEAVNALTKRLNNTAGAITISKEGEIGFGFTTTHMPWAYVQNYTLYYGIYPDEILQEDYYYR